MPSEIVMQLMRKVDWLTDRVARLEESNAWFKKGFWIIGSMVAGVLLRVWSK